jgi:hypothetical protein
MFSEFLLNRGMSAPLDEWIEANTFLCLTFRPPSLAVPTLLLPFPSKLFERSSDAALIGSPDAGRLEAERMDTNLTDCDAGFAFDVDADRFLPSAAL